MECNREEAIRAKGIAEKKMQSDDFEGARKIALKAKQLFPELENISQLLAVCDVHCSAQNKICGSEKDWYGILQVERLADELTIKKQYRKLALVLHPDKNKFPGAEAAFKLIGEANMVLSDQGKRSLYDNKCRVSVRTAITKPPPHQVNRKPGDRKPYEVQIKIPNVSNSQFSSLNHHQPTQPDMSNGRQAFWTCCPFCNIKYQYYRDFVNRALRCQNCSKPFIAYDLGAQGAPSGSNRGQPSAQGVTPGSNRGQPAFSQQKEAPIQEAFKVGAQSTGGFTSSHLGSKANSSRTLGSEPVTRTGSSAEVGGGLKTKGKRDGHAYTDGKDGIGMSKVDAAKPRESRTSRNSSRKRGRNLVVESSESCNTSSSVDTEEVVIEEFGGNPAAGQNSGFDSVHCTRRSSRRRLHVSYNESVSDDDDFMSSSKRLRESKSSTDGKEERKEEALDHQEFKVGKSARFPAAADVDEVKISAPPEGSSLYGNVKAGKQQVNGEAAFTLDPGAKKSIITDDSESNSNLGCTSGPEFYDCLEPEFSDFDKDKEEKCFSVDQIWACYDTIDGMPRFYAQVKKVFSPGFKLRITWLEADPEDQGEIDWVKEGLPVGCGKFIRGSSDETSDRLTFSHRIHCEKGSSRYSYVIYPRKGETWALFKDWDIRWSSDPENHKKYKFEIVEVLSDFGDDAVIRVAYLEKVKGFVSLFQRTTRGGIASLLIPSTEVLRFSHRIPSFKMTGKEKKGVLEGTFELDPASLPTNLNEFCHPDEVKLETESMDAKVNGSCPKSSEEKVKSTMGTEKVSTPKKCVNFEGKNDFIRETLKLRRSPRELNSTATKHDQVNSSMCSTQEGTAKHLNGTKDERSGDFTPSKGNVSSCQADEEIYIPVDISPNNFSKSPGIPPSLSSGCKVSEEVFYNFSRDKSEGKFQLGQIWALYSNKDGFLKNYVQIKKIEFLPFRLHVALLEACTLPKDMTQSVCCGMFKVQTGKAMVYPPSSFSHMLKAESIGKNKFKIYPREGEIWALYKKLNADLSGSDLKNSLFDIVEVLKDNEHCIEVSSLVRKTGFKSVFKAPRRCRSNNGILEIPRGELARFSHQIPAFQLTTEKDGRLRGCWELDSASVPGDQGRHICGDVGVLG